MADEQLPQEEVTVEAEEAVEVPHPNEDPSWYPGFLPHNPDEVYEKKGNIVRPD